MSPLNDGHYYHFSGDVTPSDLVPGNTYTFTRTSSSHPFAIKGCPNLDARKDGDSFTYTIPSDHHAAAKFFDYFCPTHPTTMRESLIAAGSVGCHGAVDGTSCGAHSENVCYSEKCVSPYCAPPTNATVDGTVLVGAGVYDPDDPVPLDNGHWYHFSGDVTPSDLVPGNTYTFTRTSNSHPFAIKGCPNLDVREVGDSFTYTIPSDHHHAAAKFFDYFCPSHPTMRESLIPINYVLMYDEFPRTVVAGVNSRTDSSLLYEISRRPSSTSSIRIRPAGTTSDQVLVDSNPAVSFGMFGRYECSPGQTVELPPTYSFVDNGNNRNSDIVIGVDALCPSGLPEIVDEGDAPIFG